MSSFPVLPSRFDRPKAGGVDVLIIAGEHSGDQHAAKIVKEILKQNPQLKLATFGGPCLREAGAQLLFDMTAFSAVGIVEVLTAYPLIKTFFSNVGLDERVETQISHMR
jgi:lipid-A-disaccharide synthase